MDIKTEPGCSSCRKDDVPLQRCSGCSRVAYCSQKCQRSQWKEHKSICDFKPTKSTKQSSASPTAPNSGSIYPANDFVWYVEISEIPSRNMNIQGPFIMKTMVLAAIRTKLELKSPGSEGLERFDALSKGGAYFDINAEPERFEAPLPDGGSISFQFVRHVNKAVKESKSFSAYTVARSDFTIHHDEDLKKQVITAGAIKAEQACTDKEQAEKFLNFHTYTVREPDMQLGVTNIGNDIVSMCSNDKKIVVLSVLESLGGCVVKAPNLSLGGPVFQKLFFMA